MRHVVEVDRAQAGQRERDGDLPRFGNAAIERALLPRRRLGSADGERFAAGAVVEQARRRRDAVIGAGMRTQALMRTSVPGGSFTAGLVSATSVRSSASGAGLAILGTDLQEGALLALLRLFDRARGRRFAFTSDGASRRR